MARMKGQGTIEKAGKSYRLRLVVNGQKKTFPLYNEDGGRCTTAKAAKVAAEKITSTLFSVTSREQLAEYIAETHDIKNANLNYTWEEAFSFYLNNPNQEKLSLERLRLAEKLWSNLKAFAETKGVEHPAALSQANVREYLFNLGETCKNTTYNAYLAFYKRIFQQFIEATELPIKNPFSAYHQKKNDSQTRLEFSPEDVQNIFTFVKDSDLENKEEILLAIYMCCFCGCRQQDAYLMQWSNVDFDSNTISYIPQKTAKITNNKSVSLPIHALLREALLSAFYKRQDSSNYICPALAEEYIENKNVCRAKMNKILKDATGLQMSIINNGNKRRACQYSMHSFRHTFVSFCVNAGVPIEVVASIVGHCSTMMTRHYSHISEEAKQGVLNALNPAQGQTFPEQTKRQRLIDFLSSADDQTIEKICKDLNLE